MGESTRMIDVEKLISYSDDLVEVLKDKRDIDNLTQCFQHFNDLRSHCDADANEVHRLLRGIFPFLLIFFPQNLKGELRK